MAIRTAAATGLASVCPWILWSEQVRIVRRDGQRFRGIVQSFRTASFVINERTGSFAVQEQFSGYTLGERYALQSWGVE